MSFESNDLSDLATIIGLLFGLFSLLLLIKEIRQQNSAIERETQIAKANTLINLRNSFHKYLHIHKRVWNGEFNDEIPEDDLIDVMSYLGQLEILLPLNEKYNLIDQEDLQNQYGFRIISLFSNASVISHINNNKENYQSLLKLMQKYNTN